MSEIQDLTEVVDKPLRVSSKIWGPRQLAIYHFIYGELHKTTGPKGYTLLDEFHGRVRALFTKVAIRFRVETASGSVGRALQPLRDAQILQNEIRAGKYTGWSIVNFVEDVPPITESLDDLWKPSGGKMKPRNYSPRGHSEKRRKDEVLAKKKKKVTDHKGAIPTDLVEKLHLMERLQEEVKDGVHALVERLYEECVALARAQHLSVSEQIEPIRSLFTIEDRERISMVLASLAHLGGLPSARVEDGAVILTRETARVQCSPSNKTAELATDEDMVAEAIKILNEVKDEVRQKEVR